MAKVTGIGGVFFKSKSDHKALTAWYAENLGFEIEDWGGAILKWSKDNANDRGLTVWHVATPESQMFTPSDSGFMINYRVDELDELLARLRSNGVTIVGEPEIHENGKFAWIMDPDGNKIELWQPLTATEKNTSP